MDLERNGLIEREHRAAVEGGKRLPIQFKGHDHNRARRFAVDLMSRFSVPSDLDDL
jgi:hypothetical protein